MDSLSDEKIKFEKLALDLPYYAKYFLIAAYIASFNSPKYDRKLFVKASNKRKKVNHIPKKSENSTSELVGPKIFSLDRLLAIFYAIIEENTNMTANLLAQVIILKNNFLFSLFICKYFIFILFLLSIYIFIKF